jgi:hypothetical protein
MRLISGIFAILAMTSISTAVNAQSTQTSFLGGLRSFTIVIASLDDEDEKNCSVTRTGLYTSLRFILDQSDITITDNVQTRDGLIYLQVTVLSNCTANIV